MCELYREGQPLLRDDLSDEEFLSRDPYQRGRLHLMGYKGRAKYKIKGAAAIITNWPDHWSSTVTHWWIGLVMISITILIIYNIAIAFAPLPNIHKPTLTKTIINNIEKITMAEVFTPNVFMHIFVDYKKDADLYKYLPYIEMISNKYLDFKYNFIVIYNDTSREREHKEFLTSAAENNELTQNELWTNSNEKERHIMNNIYIKEISLSTYMNNSPLKKHWRRLPNQFIEFIVRVISVWEKGGIALNPAILTSQSPSSVYLKEVQNIFNKYSRSNKVNKNNLNKNARTTKKLMKKKLNNIQDIIEALEKEDDPNESSQKILIEAEGRNTFVRTHSKHHLSSPVLQTKNKTIVAVSTFDDLKHVTDKHQNISVTDTTIKYSVSNHLINSDETSKPNLTNFVKYLFHDKTKTNRNISIPEKSTSSNVIKNNNFTVLSVVPKEIKNNSYSYVPIIMATHGKVRDEQGKRHEAVTDNNIDNDYTLTIDLKGNIVATRTACHAFIGTMFSNIIHHTEDETLMDLIIAELSLFCKGALSSCNGIEVVLL